ncbi:MAG TPA: hypothetical protein VLX92_32080 [Kofleriaceae bacterium]|nr:hypothetical protein [Kofleriaceae bacterium]
MYRLVVAAALAGCAHPALAPRAADPCDSPAASTVRTDRRAMSFERPAIGVARITAIDIVGVAPALADALRAVLVTKVDDMLDQAPLADDLRRMWALGVISDARIDVALAPHPYLTRSGAADAIVTFTLAPQPVIARVSGADRPELARLRWLAGTLDEPARVARVARAIELAYHRAGQIDAKVAVRRAVAAGGVALCVAAAPGPRVTISSIAFPGRHAVPERVLADSIHGGKQQINHVGGIYDGPALAEDASWMLDPYYERGMIETTIGAPQVARHGNRLAVAIPVHESPVYRIGVVRVVGGLGVPPLALVAGQVFVRSKAYAVPGAIARVTSGAGETQLVYSRIDQEARTVDLVYRTDWREPWDALRSWPAPSR